VRMPGARHLRLALSMPQSLSRGSIRTMIELVRERVHICRNGELTTIPIGQLERMFDYGDGERWSTCVNWPDTYTAAATTGIPNVEVYIEANFLARTVYRVGALSAGLLQLNAFQSLLKSSANFWSAAPAYEDASTDAQVVVAEVENTWRQCARARLRTTNGYAFTALAAVEIARRVLCGQFCAGFQTPARVYGANLVLDFESTTREDLDNYSFHPERAFS
jgi:short subunit dehydrogenase-like uncharacterized protein